MRIVVIAPGFPELNHASADNSAPIVQQGFVGHLMDRNNLVPVIDGNRRVDSGIVPVSPLTDTDDPTIEPR